MKAKLQHYCRLLAEGLQVSLRRHPVELLLIVVSALLMVVGKETDWSHWKMTKLWLLPLFALFALIVGTLAGRSPWRKLYYVSWAPLIPLLFWPGLLEWMDSVPFAITAFILLPLALLLCRRALDNRRFTDDAMIYLRSALLALLFANVALGLFEAILWSTAYIFGFADSRWVEQVATDVFIIAEMGAVPTLFLLMLDRWAGGECRGSRVLEVLVNYIVTPALMIYAAILYLYMAKILVLWELPEGGVAYMVFVFALITLVVRALQSLLDKRIGAWFYRAFSYVLLPCAVLFWVGVARRIGEYGLTSARVLLVVSGGLMTLTLLLFLTRRTGRYLYLCLAAFLVFGVMAYVPGMLPERIAARSQYKRAVELARGLDLLDTEGRLQLQRIVPDSASLHDYRRLYESLNYLSYGDDEVWAPLGIDMDDFREALPAAFYDQVVYGREPSEDGYADETFIVTYYNGLSLRDFSRYRVLYPIVRSWYIEDAVNYDFSADSLRIHFAGARPAFAISTSDLLERQLRQAGIDASNWDQKLFDEAAEELLTYRDDEVLILFSDMRLEERDSTLQLTDLTVDLVMTR